MISKKVFIADGTNRRFLSDFIIRSEQFTRVYNYIYDAGGIEGSVDPASGLFVRTSDAPTSDDLQTIDKWDLVDNSISFYIQPYAGSKVWIEVATTAEEFGDTLIQPTVAQAEAARDAAAASASSASTSATSAASSASSASTSATSAASSASSASTSATSAANSATSAASSATASASSASAAAISETNAAISETNAATSASNAATSATNAATSETNAAGSATAAQLRAWEAEAERLTADSYATEAEDVVCKVYTSDGDGTFTATPTTDYSALHWSIKGLASDKVLKSGDTMTGNLEVPSLTIGGNSVSPFNLKASATTSGTASLDANKWTKFLRTTLVAQFNNHDLDLTVIGGSSGSSFTNSAKVYLRVKQQNPLGSNPEIDISVENLNSASTAFTPSNFAAVVVQNTPTVIVDFYVKISYTFEKFNIYENARSTSYPSGIVYLSEQPFLTSITPTTSGRLGGSAEVNPTLINSWLTYSGFTPSYKKMGNGIVKLSGRIYNGANASVAFILPAGFRPKVLGLHAIAVNSLLESGYLTVASDGSCTVYFSSTPTWVSLENVQFLAEQ